MGNALVRQPRSVALAYVLWIAGFFFIAGLHRFYTGRWISGLIWLFTGGLCGVGQIVDAIFIPRMITDADEGRPVW